MEIVTEGLDVPEGPVAMDDGSVLVVEVQSGRLTRVKPDGTKQAIATLGGGPNGAAIGPDGAVYVANNGGLAMTWRHGRMVSYGPAPDYRTGAIQRVDLATGRFETLYDSCEGERLSAPNDLVFDRTGGFWFTDSGHGWPAHKDWGALYYALADGSKITRVRERLAMPNGVGLSPAQDWVYMVDSLSGSVWGCELEAPGRLKVAEVAAWTGRTVGRQAAFASLDSMAVEADGRLCVASAPERIAVMIPGGGLENVPVPDVMPTSICFGGPDMRDAWITAGAGGRLLKTRWPRAGTKLSFYA
jgi:gluconolactonase